MDGKWIWTDTASEKDTYAEFCTPFTVQESGAVFLQIACDGIYAAYVNDTLVAFSQCADFPQDKLYDEADVTQFVRKENELKIVVWHLGEDSQTYINDTAGVRFALAQNGKPLAYSCENTLSRRMNEYGNGYGKVITRQLGFGFSYDNTVAKSGYAASTVVQKPEPRKRPVKTLVLKERVPIKIIPRGHSVLVDMGREVVGFLDLDIDSHVPQKVTICYGEHVADGGVRRKIGDRDFSVAFVAKQGDNAYLNPLRRIAGRYLEIFCDAPVKIGYAGIRPVEYPVQEKPFAADDPLLQRIYDTCVYTLRCCMHEHYEDCPWREQALYTMDSRNQMLCGYYAFAGGNKEYARHNLVLIRNSLRPDGLLAICAPSGTDVPIPLFSLVYIWQVYEYVQYTGDTTILAEVGDVLDAIVRTFADKTDASGLIPSFPYPYWNFYEWAEESNNEWQINRKPTEEHKVSYDLILNCMYVYALGFYAHLTDKNFDLRNMRNSIRKTFCKDGVFVLSTATQKSSQLGNALALLIGLGDEQLAQRMITDKNMIPATLSMKAFVYDALLLFGDKYKAYILQDIKDTYGKMLQAGATTFWETDKGEADFDGAGSLCHGWSAMPVYYLHTCLPPKTAKR